MASRKPKLNYAATAKEPSSIDNCNTPHYALDPLLAYIPRSTRIWEPAMGTGRMVRNLAHKGYDVFGTGIDTGQDFFSVECMGYDMQITNPPYGIKFKWIERCYALGSPFALLLPVETIGAKRAQKMMEAHGVELLLLDRRVNFEMPNKGWEGQAQFPVLWFCWGVLPAPICYGHIEYSPEPDDVAVAVAEA